MASISVSATSTAYTVTILGGPANPEDWCALFPLDAEDGRGFLLDWQYLNGTHIPPAEGIASAVLTFPVPAPTEGTTYEFRLYASNSNKNLLARAAAPISGGGGGGGGGMRGWIDVADYGPVGTADDTATIRAAAEACKATSTGWGTAGLYFGPGVLYTVREPIDFLGISNVWAEGPLYCNNIPDTEPALKFGMDALSVGSGRYIFHEIYAEKDPGYAARRYPLVQFRGLKGAHVEIGVCNSFMEVYAEPGPYVQTFLSRFFLGSLWRLELNSQGGPAAGGNATGWINTNQFYGGGLAQLRIGGIWHDCLTSVSNNVTTVTCADPHLYVTGSLVEMYNGIPAQGQHGLITVLDGNRFTIPGNYVGSSWRCKGPAGYPHNDNSFNNTDLEDSPAILHIQGQCNRVLGCRMEATGDLIFGPQSMLNMVEVSNTTHGRMPSNGDVGDMTLRDYSNGNNFYGWVRTPKPWGQS